MKILYLAPLFLLVHIAEEAPGLVSWFNSRTQSEISMSEFIALNTIGFLVTTALAIPSIRSNSNALALGLIAWLSFLMLANGVLHLVACVVFREYVPGAVSAGVLYLPYYFFAVRAICRHFEIRPLIAVVAATVGALPMAAHGISILTVGRPLLW